MLQHEGSIEHGRGLERLDTSPICEVDQGSKSVQKLNTVLRIGTCTWKFQELCSDKRAFEIGEVLSKDHTDIIGGPEI